MRINMKGCFSLYKFPCLLKSYVWSAKINEVYFCNNTLPLIIGGLRSKLLNEVNTPNTSGGEFLFSLEIR